jgi:hypothetical protein
MSNNACFANIKETQMANSENTNTNMVELNVLNGTEIDSSTYVNLVQRYRHFAKESAANIVRLAETLVIAKQNLAPVHFDKFCEEVGLHKEGSTYRKLMIIGENASRFEPFYDQLPNAWTTVYKLASIKQNEFDRVTKSDQFSPFMTARDVTEVLGKTLVTKKVSAAAITIDLHTLGVTDQLAVYGELNKLCERYKFSLKLNDALKELVEPAAQGSTADQLFHLEQAA